MFISYMKMACLAMSYNAKYDKKNAKLFGVFLFSGLNAAWIRGYFLTHLITSNPGHQVLD